MRVGAGVILVVWLVFCLVAVALVAGLLSHPACRAAISPALQVHGFMRLARPSAALDFLAKLDAELERETADPSQGTFYYRWPEHCEVQLAQAHAVWVRCRPQASPHAVTP